MRYPRALHSETVGKNRREPPGTPGRLSRRVNNIRRARMTRRLEYMSFFTDLTGAERVDLLDGAMRSTEFLVDTSLCF